MNQSVGKFIFLALMGLFVFFGARADAQFRGYAETKFSASYAASTWLSADSDTVLSPWLTKECEWTVAEIITGTETGLDCLMVTYETSLDSVTWSTAVATAAIISAGSSVTYFTPISRVASGTNRAWKWLRLTIRDASTGDPAGNKFATLKVNLMRGCWADPHQVANW